MTERAQTGGVMEINIPKGHKFEKAPGQTEAIKEGYAKAAQRKRRGKIRLFLMCLVWTFWILIAITDYVSNGNPQVVINWMVICIVLNILIYRIKPEKT